MNANLAKKIISGITAASMLALPAGLTGLAEQEDQKEMVYVLAGAEGAVDQIIVSEHLYNRSGENVLNDVSFLTDIENLSGDEGFTQQGDELQWAANGAEIRYESKSDLPLPVSIKITYTLDGEPITPEALQGKSGRLVMRLDYEATQTQRVELDGEEAELPLPFLMLTMMLADKDVYSNIEVTNGRIMDMGNLTLVALYALPGLSDALHMEAYEDIDIEIPTYAEITADVSNYKVSGTYTLASNSIFQSIKEKGYDLDEIDFSDLTDELGDAMEQLLDGAKELLDGTAELEDGTNDLVSGVDELHDGVDELLDGVDELYDGTGDLVSGVDELYDGVGELNDGVDELVDGVGELDRKAHV